ncbi:MAG: FAD-dependent oxidoreductase [Pseudomonadota bacterium]
MTATPDRRRLLIGAGMALAGGCAGGPFGRSAGGRADWAPTAPLAPLRLSADRITRITVCTRPFRPAGPRLDAENVDGRRVVHNYGHGGSGWSLSWGCADEAAGLALSGEPGAVAVIGAGVIGLTTAIRLAERGARVTIYAADFPMETRSARATGVWSPSSRIALGDAARPDFADRWERWARVSYAAHHRYAGDAGRSVEFQPRFALRDARRAPRTPATRDYMALYRRLRELTPAWRDVAMGSLPFNAAAARGGEELIFNIATYTERLVRDFRLMGGRLERRTFADRASVLTLPERTIVNCAGYGAKALWGADDLAPVRGQIAWLPAQPEARYGVYYRGVTALSRRDGVIVQQSGPNDDYGYGLEDETPDRDEAETAIATLAPLFA